MLIFSIGGGVLLAALQLAKLAGTRTLVTSRDPAKLERGGRLVTCGATTGDQPRADIRPIFIRQLRILGSTMGDLGEFSDLLSLVRRSGLKPVIDSEFALADVHAVLDRLESSRQFGKVVIDIGSGS